MNKPFKTCFITNGSRRSEALCRILLDRGYKFDVIIHTIPLSWNECLKKYKQINLLNPLNLLRVTRLWLLNNLRKQSCKVHFLQYGKSVIFSEKLNSPAMEALLKSIKPDFIIIGDAGLLKQHIISTASIGVINSHPGLLPFCRGTGVVGRSLQRGVAVGATVHYINAGIDEGEVIRRRLLDKPENLPNLQAVEVKNDELAISLLGEIIINEIANGISPVGKPQSKKYNYCKWLSESERTEMDNLVKSGLPMQLYLKWIGLCKPGSTDLRDDIMEIISA